ncbi:Ste11p [Saccharomyces cerevisiae FostersO]|nr:Ste11p [Saccharomyces cerevisiae FostersO]
MIRSPVDEIYMEQTQTAEGTDLLIGDEKTNDLPFVQLFLEEIGCTQYLDSFIQCNLVTEEEIKYLDKDILIALGVNKIGDRLKILRKSKSFQRDKRIEQVNRLKNLMEKVSSLSTATLSMNSELIPEKHCVIFILNDGSAKKVNVNGCFNADSIKKRLIRRLPHELLATNSNGEVTKMVQDYDVFVLDYTKNVLHLLYDVELVTICHANDRVEKNRLIFVSKDQTPSDEAISTSKKLYLRTLSALSQVGPSSSNLLAQNKGISHNNAEGKLRIDNTEKDRIRQIFNQRPPSEFISTNLAGYFPHTDMKRLQKTMRESFRHSARLSIAQRRPLSAESNNIGDILLKHSNAVDMALLQGLDQTRLSSKLDTTKIPKLAHKRPEDNDAISNQLELLSVESGEEEDHDFFGEDSDIVSLPTKIATPKNWLKGACIGSGSFGSVYLGMNAHTGELMAVKQVEIKNNNIGVPTDNNKQANSDENNEQEEQQEKIEDVGAVSHPKTNQNIHRKMVDALQHEMNLLKELHHENIVTYYGASQEGGNLNIFLEYVPGGSVSSMLNNYGPFEESLITNFTRQILIGVAYLHKKNIIHRDIKGANILIDIKGCVKITDFGISKKLSPLNKKQNKRASLQGSVFWMSPEVVKQTATTAKADIWSTGCVVIEMFTGKHPFPDFSQMQAIFKIGTNTTPEIPSWATSEGKNFLRKAFELDYQYRPSALELLQHPWLDAHII